MIPLLKKHWDKLNLRLENYCQNLAPKKRKRIVIIGFIAYVLLTVISLLLEF